MRVLIAAFCPLVPELGAGQMALNLAAALRARGLDAEAWSAGLAPAGLATWRRTSWKRRRLVEHVASTGPYDIVDAPPLAISGRLARLVPVIARSVQPDLRYLACEARTSLRDLLRRPVSVLAAIVLSAHAAAQVIAGWHRAKVILCLGSNEFEWMRRWFPWLRKKLALYVNALSEGDRSELRAIREWRKPRTSEGTRFLWLGRWSAHKGTDRLIEFIRQRVRSQPADSFTIAGCGPEATRDLPKEVTKSHRVDVVPSYTRQELFELLRSHDAGLFTSVVEGWGLSLNEMLESGMPVYATREGGVTDLGTQFAGLLRDFPPPPVPMAAMFSPNQAIDPAEECFTWHRIAAEYENKARACLAKDLP